MICNKCETEFDDNLEQCPNCNEPVYQESEAAMDKLKDWLNNLWSEQYKSYTICVIVLFLICACGSLFYFNNQYENSYTKQYREVNEIINKNHEISVNNLTFDKLFTDEKLNTNAMQELQSTLQSQKQALSQLHDKFSNLENIPTKYKEQHNAVLKLLQAEVSLTDMEIAFTNAVSKEKTTEKELGFDYFKDNLEIIFLNYNTLVDYNLIKPSSVDLHQLPQNMYTIAEKKLAIIQKRERQHGRYIAFFNKLDTCIAQYKVTYNKLDNLGRAISRGGSMFKTLFADSNNITYSCSAIRNILKTTDNLSEFMPIKNEFNTILSKTIEVNGLYYNVIDLQFNNHIATSRDEYRRAEQSSEQLDRMFNQFLQEYENTKRNCLKF